MSKLSLALKGNALFSGISGIVLIGFSQQMARVFEASDHWPFWSVGIILVLFAGMVFVESRKSTNNRLSVMFIIISDVLWVIASGIVTTGRLFNINNTGYIIIIIVAVIVAIFAVTQWVFQKN